MIVLPTTEQAKSQAKRLRSALRARGDDPGHAAALELVAAAHGVRDWNTLAATAPSRSSAVPPVGAAVPILRIFDAGAAESFYLGFLGWHLDWEHRFDDHAPRYVQLSSPGGVRVHLSEHHGDGTPGSAVLIEVPDAGAVHADLTAKDYPYAKPGLETPDWGRTVTVYDPFGNRITFLEPAPADELADRVPDELDPIVHELTVTDDPEAAFARFTSFRWWRDYGLDPAGTAVIENGTLIFRNPDGDRPVGEVTSWQPGRRYGQTFILAQDPDHPTTLTVTFEAAIAGSTRVRFEHGGWNATNAGRRSHFADWPEILARYVDRSA